MTPGRRRAVALAAVWVLPSAFLLSLSWCVYSRYRIEPPARLSEEARAEAVAALRTSLDTSAAARPRHPELDRRLPDGGPLIVTLWHEGKPRARVEAEAGTVAEAIREATELLPRHPAVKQLEGDALRRARLKVDLVLERGPLAHGSALLEAVALNPGIDGIGVTLDGGIEHMLLPDELYLRRLLFASKPLSFVPEFSVGLDFERADMLLARRAGLPAGAYAAADKRYWRFRTDSFVERPVHEREVGAPLPLYRGLPPGPPLTEDSLRAAALRGARYLIRHLASNGRYIYEVELTIGNATDPFQPGPYSIPRHAGTTYFLAELYRITGEEFLREPIERAFAHLEELIEAGGCTGRLPDGAEFACVVDEGQTVAALGSTALTVVALAEYQRATGDDRYEPLARRLTEWILFMQKDDGAFAHLYDIPEAERDLDTQLLYYSGESALALARMHVVTGEARYRDATEAALDALVRWYDFFVGGFFYGEEHWTCIAAEAAWPAVQNDRYREFCNGYAEFLRQQQPVPGDHPDQRDWAGSYGFTPFIVPHNTPAGSRSEAMISAYRLGVHHGQPEPAIREQVLRAMRYALRQQIRAGSAWNVVPRSRGIGAVPASPIDRKVRIDYVQHVCSAMIRSLELIESDPG